MGHLFPEPMLLQGNYFAKYFFYTRDAKNDASTRNWMLGHANPLRIYFVQGFSFIKMVAIKPMIGTHLAYIQKDRQVSFNLLQMSPLHAWLTHVHFLLYKMVIQYKQMSRIRNFTLRWCNELFKARLYIVWGVTWRHLT